MAWEDDDLDFDDEATSDVRRGTNDGWPDEDGRGR